MTKIQLIELVQRALAGGDSPADIRGRYHENEIALYLSAAMDTLLARKNSIRQELSEEMGLHSYKYDQLTKPFILDITLDEARQRYYSELPAKIISISNNDGIRMISPTQEESTAFLPRRTQDIFLMNDLDVNLISGLIYYSLEGNKIWYAGEIDCHWKQVLAKLAIKFTEFEDNDEINIPQGNEAELIQMTIQLMAQKNPSDIVDDSTALQTTK